MKLDPQQIAKICSGKLTCSRESQITGISTDTRTIKPGDLFVALKGHNFDGHNFIDKAINAGAAAIIYSDDTELHTQECQSSMIRVKDCLAALQQLATFYRSKSHAFFIGVTGSNGKTTTREMLYYLLSNEANCHSTKGNLNNHIGLPLTLLGTDPEAKFAVIEMGMNHAGEIRHLCQIAKPDAALISNIGPAHIGILKSLTNIAKAKAEVLEQLQAHQFAVIPGDTEFTELFHQSTSARLFTFGTKPHNTYRITDIRESTDSVAFSLSFNEQSHHCLLALSGAHNAFNAVAALAVYNQLGHDLEKGIKRLSQFKPVSARMEKHSIDGINIIVDCYNANPGSMLVALQHLHICPPGRVAVLGDMRELGELSIEMHKNIGTEAAKLGIELLVCVGADATHMASAAIASGMHEDSVIALSSNDEAAELLSKRLKKGSTILFKASRGMHFETILRKLWPGMAKDLR